MLLLIYCFIYNLMLLFLPIFFLNDMVSFCVCCSLVAIVSTGGHVIFLFFSLVCIFFVAAVVFSCYCYSFSFVFVFVVLLCSILFIFDIYLRSEIESAKSKIQFFLLLHVVAEDNNSLFCHLLDHPYKYHFSSLVYLSNLMSSNVDLCN